MLKNEPLDGLTPNLTRITLDEVLNSANWSKSSAALFEQVIKGAPAESEKSARGMSAQWFFLHLMFHGGNAPKDGSYSTSAVFRASGLTMDRLRRLQQRIGGEPARSVEGGNSIYLVPDLAGILAASAALGRRVGNDGITSIRHILAAFVFRTTEDGRLLSYLNLESLGIPTHDLLSAFRQYVGKGTRDTSPDAKNLWNRAVELLDNVLIGRQMRFNRDASNHEKCLEVDRYAEVLATLMRQADDKEFTLAIYGDWGRGKTYLMKRTAEALRTPPPEDPREFETVTFSTWQYPSRPEVWIHLYETFAKAAFDSGVLKSLPNIVRAGLARHGYWRLLFAYFLGAIALISLPTKLELAGRAIWQYYSAVGLAGVLLTYAFYNAVKGTHKRLKAYYLTAKKHSEKLGLQATIGDDLAALLKGWLPINGVGPVFYTVFYGISVFAAATLWWRIQHSWSDKSLWIGAIPAAVLLIGTIFVCRWLFPWKPKGKKLLLNVDDLDRCDPDHLLSVMESIKLMLENPEISRRVLAAMLIEEDILRHAIWRKYNYLADEAARKALGTQFNGERIARENCEKLFTVHLRLPSLESDEIASVVAKFALRDDSKLPGAAPGDSTKSRTTTAAKTETTEETQKATKAAKLYIDGDVTNEITLLAANQIVLGDEERKTIASALCRQRTDKNHIAPLGPRAIRAFIFRYQLTRLILAKRGLTDWQPGVLIAALAQRLFQETDPPETLVDLRPEVAAVVRQVT